MKLTRTEAIEIILSSQSVYSNKLKSVVEAIRTIRLLQIDTINVINRSPYVVLWSRLSDYETCDLDDALKQKQIFEYWAHAACFIPIEDYPIFRRIQISGANGAIKYYQKWIPENIDGVNKIRIYIEQNGEVKSSDFSNLAGRAGRSSKSEGWWNWKFEKLALEALFATGELMVARRENFQRVYTLRENLLPNWIDTDAPPLNEVIRTQLESGLKALGVAKLDWIKDYYRPYITKSEVYKIYKDLIKKSIFLPIEVDGFYEPFYYHKDSQYKIEEMLSNQVTNILTNQVTFLSPFDPIVWDRFRLKELFDFEYLIECYTPEAKRKYGYFTLPILYGTNMIGRFDAKAHRKTQIFEIKSLHFEPNIKVDLQMKNDLKSKFQEFATWHKCANLKLPNF
jgi:uncharacterized protein